MDKVDHLGMFLGVVMMGMVALFLVVVLIMGLDLYEWVPAINKYQREIAFRSLNLRELGYPESVDPPGREITRGNRAVTFCMALKLQLGWNWATRVAGYIFCCCCCRRPSPGSTFPRKRTTAHTDSICSVSRKMFSQIFLFSSCRKNLNMNHCSKRYQALEHFCRRPLPLSSMLCPFYWNRVPSPPSTQSHMFTCMCQVLCNFLSMWCHYFFTTKTFAK